MTLHSKSIFTYIPRLVLASMLLVAAWISAPAQTNTFPSSGDVGVGTTTPDQYANIHISKAASAGMDIQASDTTGWARMRLRTSSRVWGWFAGGASQGDAPNKMGLYDYTANAFRMMFDPSGNVGIGTNSPTSRLHIAGTNDNLFQVNSTGSLANDTVAYFSSAVGPNMIIRGNGNVGIGTTSPGGPLDVRDSSGRQVLWNMAGAGHSFLNANGGNVHVAGNLYFNGTNWNRINTGATGGMWWAGGDGTLAVLQTPAGANPVSNFNWSFFIGSNGSVGIGNVNPAYKLDVNGEINATGLRINGTPISGGGGGGSQWGGTAGNPIFYTGGNVGIGAQTPGARLDIGAGSTARGSYSDLLIGTGGNNPQMEFYGPTKSSAIAHDEALGGLVFYTNGPAFAPSMFVTNGGNVGIGTTNPTAGKLQVQTAGGVGLALLSGSSSAGQHTSMQIGRASADGTLGVASQSGEYASNAVVGDIILRTESPSNKLILNSGTGAATLVVNNGNVGVGNNSPSEKLHVTGNGKFTGNVTVDGTINAKYQDVAEWVPSSEQLSTGTVVVLDTTKSNQVVSSGAAYDTRVAGVISAQPGITLGEGGDGKVLVATTGRVRVRVDASRGSIQIGDLLVTSDVPGVAMKSEPVEFAGRKMHMPGTIIGKALEPLAKGKGEILVLLSLQ